MAMTPTEARDRLEEGDHHLEKGRGDWDRRQDYLEGRQDLPYAPPGVNQEYQALREQSIANWLAIAMAAPLQRLRADGFSTGRGEAANQQTWDDIWQPNALDSRQGTVYLDMLVHKRGLMSVWPDATLKGGVRIRPESGRAIHLEGDPEDPWTQAWAVKRIDRKGPRRASASGLWTPPSVTLEPETLEVGYVYDRDEWHRFQRGVITNASGVRRSEWEHQTQGGHRLGGVPFVPFDNRPTSGAKPRSDIEPLMPAQDALNTIRFQTLLAMQFSAYRQRIVVGFDPVARDESGATIYRKNADGSLQRDSNGLPIPVVVSPGRPGVDRLLVFPGDATKVFDLPESDLGNYVTVLGEFLSQLFAVGQVPPQYLLSKMANLSGDALTAAESTLNSYVKGLQLQAGESLEAVMRMANRARGDGQADLASEVIWAQAEVRSFAQVVDAIVKLITSGMAPEDAWSFLPDATPAKLKTWTGNAEQRRTKMLGEAGLKLPVPGADLPVPQDGRPGQEPEQGGVPGSGMD